MVGTQFTDSQLTDWAWHSGGYPDQYSDGQLLISLHLIGWPWRESLEPLELTLECWLLSRAFHRALVVFLSDSFTQSGWTK